MIVRTHMGKSHCGDYVDEEMTDMSIISVIKLQIDCMLLHAQ